MIIILLTATVTLVVFKLHLYTLCLTHRYLSSTHISFISTSAQLSPSLFLPLSPSVYPLPLLVPRCCVSAVYLKHTRALKTLHNKGWLRVWIMHEVFYIGIDGCQSCPPKSRQHRSFPFQLLDVQVESTFAEPHAASQSQRRRGEEIPRRALINIRRTKVSPRPRLFNLCIQYRYLHASITEQTSSFKSSYANVWHLKQTLHEKRTYNNRLWFFSVPWTYAVSIFMTLKLWHLWSKSLQRYFLRLFSCSKMFSNSV